MLVCSALSWAVPGSRPNVQINPSKDVRESSTGRRQAITAFSAFSACLLPSAVHAQRSKLIPRSSKESTESFKAFQLSQPGNESPEFQAAEKLRLQRLEGGGEPKKESDSDTIKRLGLKTYGEAVDEGYDQCKTWKGCRDSQ